MLRLLLAIVFVIIHSISCSAAVELKEEGTSQGYINRLNFIGDGVTAARSGIQGNITLDVYTKDEVNSIVEGNTFDFFLNDALSGIGSPEYFTMDPSETGLTESTFSGTITGDAFLIDSFVTSTSEPTFTELVAGIYALHIHADTTTGANVGTARIYWEFYKRTHPGGVETLLITSEESNILIGSATEIDIHGTASAVTVLGDTDRLVIKIYANIEVSRPSDPIVTLRAEGTTATHFEVVTTLTAFDDRYVEVEGDTMTGQLLFSGSGIPKKRVYISASAGLVPTTTGAADAAQVELGSTDINRINVMTVDFDAAIDEYWIAHFTLPENYDGDTFTAAVSWTCTADASKGVAWFIQLLGMSDGDVMGATDFGTAVETNDDGQTTNDYLLSPETAAITENHAGGSGTTVGGDELWVKLYRDISDGDDDLTTDAKMIGLWLTFGTDALSTED